MKTAKHSIMETTPRDSRGAVVFWRERCWWNSTGLTPDEGCTYVG